MTLSVKKSLGVVGYLWLFVLATIMTIKDPSLFPSTLLTLAGLVGTMFGIKAANGWIAKKYGNGGGGE